MTFYFLSFCSYFKNKPTYDIHWCTLEPEWMWAHQAKLQHPLTVLGLGVSHVRLDCRIPWQAQDLGLEAGFLGELWVLPCWATASPGDHES